MVRALMMVGILAALLLGTGCSPETDNPPEARSERVVMPINGTAQGWAHGWDPDGDAVQFELVGAPAYGTLVFDTADGAYSYVPFTNVHGTDQFSFRVHSASGSSGLASVAFDIGAAG